MHLLFDDRHQYTPEEAQEALLVLYHARVHATSPRYWSTTKRNTATTCSWSVDEHDQQAWRVLHDVQAEVCMAWGEQQVNRLVNKR
jgi:hypothetical protein